jgi:alpha-ketoglutarate-dependent taurine dioxygenase
MPVITRQIGPCFAAEVEGVDMTKPLSADEVAAIHAGMDRYAVLVFHDQKIDDDQQLAFTDFSDEERERFKPVRQCLVRTHPVTGRKSLYLSSHAGSILGWAVPEARAFLRDLVEHATQRQLVYVHRWRVGDLVMWDNRQTMHRARPFPVHEPRDMRRTTLMGEAPTVAQVA